jgi:hypothetical protein
LTEHHQFVIVVKQLVSSITACESAGFKLSVNWWAWMNKLIGFIELFLKNVIK